MTSPESRVTPADSDSAYSVAQGSDSSLAFGVKFECILVNDCIVFKLISARAIADGNKVQKPWSSSSVMLLLGFCMLSAFFGVLLRQSVEKATV